MLKAVSFLVVAAVFARAEIEKDEGVLVLTADNFESAVADNQFILVEFYAPWCGHCKALKPEYEKAAKALSDEGSAVALAKVDATQEPKLAEQFEVRGYPTLKFFKNKTPVEYNGGRTAEEIVAWLKKKTGPPAKTLTSADEAKDFKDSAEVVVVGYFANVDSDEAKEYLKSADKFDDIPFAISSSDDVKSALELTKEGVVVFQKFDEGRADYTGAVKEEELSAFIRGNSLPLVVEFSQATAQKIFGGEIKSHVLLFAGKSSEGYKGYVEAASKVAKDYKGQILFVTINSDDDEHVRILEFFGMSTEDVPTMRIIKLEDEMLKYKPDTADLTEASMSAFVKDFLAGKLKQHLLSQTLPEDWNTNPVWVLASSNFDEVVFDKTKDVLVEFYAPWCGHCKQLAPIFDQLGEKFKDNAEVVIAKMDATANELEHTKIQSFPTLKFYPKGTGSAAEATDYNGARTLDALAAFVESGGKAGASGGKDEEEEEEEDVPSKDEL